MQFSHIIFIVLDVLFLLFYKFYKKNLADKSAQNNKEFILNVIKTASSLLYKM